ncbi:PucR family transcriptional regulator [Jatrophihabitans telluris]|uniref:PucR family transcriptional regulator n=1 Tax=Jatrophihabitans telluris TaxID=2038343 RepID=A0ABY4R1Q6_9ACTN|nr:PucR family transcriptional regulator [Jatrophihabitans telluris]UQX89846.1 PucR family transcriptional regulator [Jatrophihabitans telluris]
MTSEQALTVETLLRSPALQLSVIAGESGLDRSVSWAHVSELADPTPWLLGAEMIMTTGLAIPRNGADQRAYLERLDDAGVSALALSEELHVPPLRREFLRAADSRGIPVLRVPLPVPFIAIAQEVAAALQPGVGQRLGAQLQVFGSLRWLTEENLDVAEIFARLERLSGYRLFVCSQQGRPLLPGVRTPDARLLGLLPASPAAPPTVPGGFVLPIQAPGGVAGYLFAQARHGAAPGGLAVVQHVATVASLQLTMRRHERETLRREGAETLAELLGGVLEPPVARRRLSRLGLPLRGMLTLAVLRGRAGDADDASLLRRLDEADLAHLVLRQQDELFVLVPAGLAAQRAFDAVADAFVGSSAPLRTGDSLEIPRREARWAVARARDAGKTHLTYGENDSAGRWLPEDVQALDALVERVLGKAIAYDEGHSADLLTTVRTWMERDRHAESTAAALGIHQNTLAYRLRRFGEITGRDLARTSEFSEVWMALLAQRSIGSPG